jgi:formate hydrogenlyase subunit 6/NADH:ubiquinone oxidoreductase subunit I
MALDERKLADGRKLTDARRAGFGLGLLKGMAVTLKHLFKHNTVIEYPDEKQDLPSRTRGVIALKEENCTVCMLCARECPDWCIYIDSHKETLPPKRAGGRPRKRNVLDRFAIDYALCMYCGICVEVCPYDALFWSREFEYSEYDVRQLTHEKERLSDWMATVLPPPDLEEGAELPGQPAAAASPTVEATGARPATLSSSAAEARPQQAATAPREGSFTTEPARPASSLPAEQQASETRGGPAPETAQPAPGLETEVKAAQGMPGATTQPEPDVTVAPDGAAEEVTPPPDRSQVGPDAAAVPEGREREPAPSVATEPKVTASEAVCQAALRERPAPQPPAPSEDPEAAYERVLREQLDKGSSPQVAEARAKVARVKAERGIARPPAPAPATAPVPSAPQTTPTEPEPSGAPEAREPAPDPGPVAPTEDEDKADG